MQLIKVLLFGFMFISLTKQETEWKKSLDKDDIIVYTRKIQDKRFSEILAITKMNGSIDKFKSIITNVVGYKQWITDCKSVEVIDSSNVNEITYHMKLKVPFPFENRDIVQQINITESTDKLEVLITNQQDKLPREKKFERMIEAFGTWTVETISENEVSIKFQYYADPSGDIPAWLVNAFIVKNPHQTMKNLRVLMQ